MVTFVKGYFRKMPDKPRLMDNDFHMNLRSYVVGLQCVEAVERAFAEPLDGEEFDDLSDDDRKRLRESF